MAEIGTGLPLERSKPATIEPGQHSAVYTPPSSAGAWSEIAAAGDKMEKTFFHGAVLEQHQAQIGYLAGQDVEIARQRADLRDEHDGDPAAFDAAWKGYSDGKLAQAQPWAVPHLTKILGHEGNGAYSGLLTEKRSTDRKLDVDKVTALLDQSGNDVIGSAMTGTFGTPDGQAKVDKYAAVLKSAVDAKMIAPEEMDRRLADINNRAGAEVIIKSIGDTYRDSRANGETAGPLALKRAEDEILRGKLPMSEDQRYAYYHKATAEIRALEAERKQDLGMARVAMQNAMVALSQGVKIDQGTIESLTTQLNGAGGQADSAKLLAAVARSETLSSFGKLPLSEMNQSLMTYGDQARYAGAPKGTPEQVAAVTATANRLGITPRDLVAAMSYETGGTFNPSLWGGRGNNYLGLIQFGPEERAKYGVKPGMTIEQQMPAIEAFLRDRGVKPGMDITSIYKTINGGNPNVSINASDGNGTIGQHVERIKAGHYSVADKFLGATGTVPGSTGQLVAGPGQDYRLVAGSQRLVNDKANEQWKLIAAGLDTGVRPTPQDLHDVIQAASLTGNHDLLETIGARLDRFDAKVAAGRAPLADTESAASAMSAEGELHGLTPGQGAYVKDMQAVISDVRQKLSTDAVGLGVDRFPERFPPPKPLDTRTSEGLQAGLAERARIAGFVSQNYGVGAVSALRPADIQNVKAALQAGDAVTKARIFGDMTLALPKPILDKTMADLAKDGGADAMVSVFAGSLYGQSPEIASSVLRGQTALKSDKRFNALTDEKSTFLAEFDKALPIGTFGLEAKTDDQGAYHTIKNVVLARYADLSAQANDVTANINPVRLQQAVTDVTGGVVTHNGGSVIVPRRGMNQQQFDGALFSVGDPDLAGVTTMSGTPVTAHYLRETAQLESHKDGRYLVRLGNDPMAPIYAVRNADTESPSIFVLDLRGRTGVAPFRAPALGYQFSAG